MRKSNPKDDLINDLLNSNIIIGIGGNYVFEKFYQNNHEIKDIRIIGSDRSNSQKIIREIVQDNCKYKLKYMRQYCRDYIVTGYEEEPYSDCVYFKYGECKPNLDINIIHRSDMYDFNMFNSLILTKDGIKHVLQVPEIWDTKQLSGLNGNNEYKWITQKFKEKKYCHTSNLEELDSKGWTLISENECAKHGY